MSYGRLFAVERSAVPTSFSNAALVGALLTSFFNACVCDLSHMSLPRLVFGVFPIQYVTQPMFPSGLCQRQ